MKNNEKVKSRHTQGQWESITWHKDNNPRFSSTDISVRAIGAIMQINHLNIPDYEAEANGKRIVKCVNMHDELIATLAELTKQVEMDCSIGSDPRFMKMLQIHQK